MTTSQWVAVVAPVISLLLGSSFQWWIARGNRIAASQERKDEREQAAKVAREEREDRKKEADAQRAHDRDAASERRAQEITIHRLSTAEKHFSDAIDAVIDVRQQLSNLSTVTMSEFKESFDIEKVSKLRVAVAKVQLHDDSTDLKQTNEEVIRLLNVAYRSLRKSEEDYKKEFIVARRKLDDLVRLITSQFRGLG